LAHLFEGWHFVLTKVLALSIFLHIAGAIKHHVIDKDATLRRMLPGNVYVPDPTPSDHTLGITVKQLGSDVSGSFADWTADIKFDPETETGSVNVTISVASLTLGSVTKDALGADYLDATTSPQATFKADINRIDQGLVADGTLTIRDTSLPLQLPFTLDIVDGLATAKGQASLNRIDYGIGATAQPSELNLGFNVVIDVDLQARAPD